MKRKKLLLSLIAGIGIASSVLGQVTFFKETNVDLRINLVGIHMLGEHNFINGKKMVIATSGTSYSIYDENFNFLKTVHLDSSGLHPGVSMIKAFISDKIVNKDDKLEFIYSYPTDLEKGRTVVINEDGAILFDEVSSEKEGYFGAVYRIFGKPYLVKNGETNGVPYFKYYSLGGDLPCLNSCDNAPSGSRTIDSNPINILLYPNPASSNLTVEIKGDVTVTNYELYDISGKLVQTDFITTGSNTIDVSSLTTGTYVCKLTNNGDFLFSDTFVKK